MLRTTFPYSLSTIGAGAALLCVSLVANGQGAERALNASFQAQSSTIQESVRTQARIAQLADETTELLGEYRVTVQQLDRLRIYNNHLQRLVNDQEAEKADINRQLTDFTVVEQEIIPLMMSMIDTLGEFIDLDMPFLLEERRDRVSRLRDNMDQADITVSEKYRQIMQAYQIETDYGRTMEAYKGTLEIGDAPREVDLLRVGRVLLAYQTPDRENTGFWNKTTRRWEALPGEYRNAITDGLRIANKQAAPDLLKLPVPSAEPASE